MGLFGRKRAVKPTASPPEAHFGAINELEQALESAASVLVSGAARGQDVSTLMEQLSPTIAAEAAKVRDAGDVNAVATGRSFFDAQVAVNLHGQPALMGHPEAAKSVLMRCEAWMDEVLGPFLAQPVVSSHFDLTAVVSHSDESYRLAQRLWGAAGLNIAVHGPGSADQLVEMLSIRVPKLKGMPHGPFLELVEPNLRLCIALLEGSSGSACVISEASATGDDEFDAEKLSPGIISVDMLNSPPSTADGQGVWETTIFSRGLTDSDALANRLRDARVLEHDRYGVLVG